jgi:hypothetical protein
MSLFSVACVLGIGFLLSAFLFAMMCTLILAVAFPDKVYLESDEHDG